MKKNYKMFVAECEREDEVVILTAATQKHVAIDIFYLDKDSEHMNFNNSNKAICPPDFDDLYQTIKKLLNMYNILLNKDALKIFVMNFLSQFY